MSSNKLRYSLLHQKRCTEKARKYFEVYPKQPLVLFLCTKSHKLPIAIRTFSGVEKIIQDLLELEGQAEETGSKCFVYDQYHLFNSFRIPAKLARQCIHSARKEDAYKYYFSIDPANRFEQKWLFPDNKVDPFS